MKSFFILINYQFLYFLFKDQEIIFLESVPKPTQENLYNFTKAFEIISFKEFGKIFL